jgi:hypothetical protein
MVANPLMDNTAPEGLEDPLELTVVTQDHSMEDLVIRLPALIPDIQLPEANNILVVLGHMASLVGLLILAALLLILREE